MYTYGPRIHPGDRKANPDASKTGKPKYKGFSNKALEELIEKETRNKRKAIYIRELEKRLSK
jgi:hypothetical protein